LVGFRQAEASLLSVASHHLQQVASGLLLQPLACVSLVDSGCIRELSGCHRTAVCEGTVETEAVAEIHREEIERADRVCEKSRDQRVATLAVISFARHQEISLDVVILSLA
jgi:hypothetical protein